jgi:phosphoglycerate kinase
MPEKMSIKDLPIKGKKVLVRVDFNVPIDADGTIRDDTRIVSSLPTIQYILKQGGAVILMSHLGRPKGDVDPKLSLAPCAKLLSKLLDTNVQMANDCIGSEVEQTVKNLKPGDVLLLENLRFHNGEEHPEQDPSFAKQLAALGDLYVNDAFGTAHRKHSSTATITDYFQGKSAAGFLMEQELKYLGEALSQQEHPFVAIIGGAKVSSKIGVLKSLLKKVDVLLVGGGMAYTFYKALGYTVGDSICEDNLVQEAKEILEEGKRCSVKIVLPIDNVIVKDVAAGAATQIVDSAKGIPNHYSGVDIGPKTIKQFERELENARIVFWNGPLGVFEIGEFAAGTEAIAKVVAGLVDATTIIGGGDSVAAVKALGYADQITHISTGGGATLEYIEFGQLPGIEALSDGGKVNI